MKVCLFPRSQVIGCGTLNQDEADICYECGRPLRLALPIGNGIVGDRYRILNGIGCGGFGAVYRAEDIEEPGTLIALKESFNPDLARSFQDEFTILKDLQHDHLPRYENAFNHQESAYLVMEFVEGSSLEERLEANPQGILEKIVLRYAEDLCDVVGYLHQQNIIHRDIKPANIRMTPDGLLKLVDFGLLKQTRSVFTRETRRGYSSYYSPPEQHARGKTTERSDIYGIGATLYHLLTGTPPPDSLEERDPDNDPIRHPQDINPLVSSHISRVLMQALALNPEERFASVTEFANALRGQEQETPAFSLTHRAGNIPRSNQLFPVSPSEWHDELARCNEVFGRPAGYWCYVQPGRYRIGGWKPGQEEATLAMPGFWIAKFPVSVQQYRQFLGAHGYTTRDYWTPAGWGWRITADNNKGRTHPHYWPGANHHDRLNCHDNQPLVTITWYEAAAFAAWLNTELANSLPAGFCVRLPTEAEWEVAAAYDSAGNRFTYPWGEARPDKSRADFGKSYSTEKPALVDELPMGEAACGALGMAGGVWEPVTSSYEVYPAQAAGVVDDFQTSDYDVPWRGGSWGENSERIGCGARDRSIPGCDYNVIGGFRLVLSPIRGHGADDE